MTKLSELSGADIIRLTNPNWIDDGHTAFFIIEQGKVGARVNCPHTPNDCPAGVSGDGPCLIVHLAANYRDQELWDESEVAQPQVMPFPILWARADDGEVWIKPKTEKTATHPNRQKAV